MITIKVSYPNPELSRGPTPFPQQSPEGKGIWGDYQFVFSNDANEYDYWVVVDRIEEPETARIPTNNTILLTQESPAIGAYPVSFINQFCATITCHPDILANPAIKSHRIAMQPALAWFVNKGYSELAATEPIQKTKQVSLITSISNRKRYTFAMALKEHFGDSLDLFGRGINPVKDKWDALSPYKYSIVLENAISPDYFSEKLTDAFLAYTFPIYYGGAAGRYFPQKSFVNIDINKPEQAIRLIEAVLGSEDHYARNLPVLSISRWLALNTWNFFPTIISLIELHTEWFDEPGTNLADVTISNLDSGRKNQMMFLKRVISQTF